MHNVMNMADFIDWLEKQNFIDQVDFIKSAIHDMHSKIPDEWSEGLKMFVKTLLSAYRFGFQNAAKMN